MRFQIRSAFMLTPSSSRFSSCWNDLSGKMSGRQPSALHGQREEAGWSPGSEELVLMNYEWGLNMADGPVPSVWNNIILSLYLKHLRHFCIDVLMLFQLTQPVCQTHTHPDPEDLSFSLFFTGPPGKRGRMGRRGEPGKWRPPPASFVYFSFLSFPGRITFFPSVLSLIRLYTHSLFFLGRQQKFQGC